MARLSHIQPQWRPEDLLALRPGQDTEPVVLVVTDFRKGRPTLSPDGRWLAYTSNETGSEEIYVVPFPNAGDAKWAVSTNGGTEPVWSHSGQVRVSVRTL